MAATPLIDINIINHLYDVATGGRSKSARTRAERKLGEILGKEIDRANQRMRELEKQGLDYGPAYDAASEYLEQHGRKRFKRPGKNQTVREKYEEALRARQFLASKTSTVTGQKAEIKKRNDTFRERWPELTENMDDKELEDFQRFLGTPGLGDYLDAFYDSGDQIEFLGELFEAANEDEKQMDEIKGLFAEYEAFSKWREENPLADISEREGLTHRELVMELDKIYESIEKRRR